MKKSVSIIGGGPAAMMLAANSGSFQVSFFYSTVEGFQIRNEMGSLLWLFVPSPAVDMLLTLEVKPPSGKPRKVR